MKTKLILVSLLISLLITALVAFLLVLLMTANSAIAITLTIDNFEASGRVGSFESVDIEIAKGSIGIDAETLNCLNCATYPD